MAVTKHEAVTTFDQWYVDAEVNTRDNTYYGPRLAPCAEKTREQFRDFKREHDGRVDKYYKLEMLANGEVISKKEDLANISSGETAGIVRRIARNLVQNVPNVEVVSVHDNDSAKGVLSRFVLGAKIIGSDVYNNDMQQNLFSSTKTAFTIGFDCVVPILQQAGDGSWFIKYDAIHYRDVFPEPGVKDIREANSVFIRRYLTRGEVKSLIDGKVTGWDEVALRTLLKSNPPNRQQESVSHQDKSHKTIPKGYEIATLYTDTGDPFLTFDVNSGLLLRIEINKHPSGWHPVHFLVLEKDSQQPLGKSQVELLLGRQEFQDLLFNGAMKQYYRNVNPAIIGYGTVNALPNLSPGKYTEIGNPNARIEPFEVNTQTLLQIGQITQANLGSMVQMVGAADQQMAMQSGSGMSATPAGVEAQQGMVDITTNNYQKAIESFFSHYCSYALTLYFYELQGNQKLQPSADARKKLLNAGMPADEFDEDGSLKVTFSEMATQYYVRCIPGSLVEIEDEKQLRILNQLLVSLSQSMQAISASGDQVAISNATATMQFIIQKIIVLSGSADSQEMKQLFLEGHIPQLKLFEGKQAELESNISGLGLEQERSLEGMAASLKNMQEQIGLLTQTNQLLFEKLGITNAPSAPEQPQLVAAQ